MSEPLTVTRIGSIRTAHPAIGNAGADRERGPRRPNPIGLHLVRIITVDDDGFAFAGVDMLDQTPLLDIKPWAATLDLPHGRPSGDAVRSGWFDTVDLTGPHTPDSLRANRKD